MPDAVLEGGGLLRQSLELARETFAEPRGQKWQVLALDRLGKRKEALARLASAAGCSTAARPAVSSLVVDQVVNGELTACGYFTSLTGDVVKCSLLCLIRAEVGK